MTFTLDPSTGFGGDAEDHFVLTGTVDSIAGALLGSMLAERLAAGAERLELDLSAVEAIDAEGLVSIVRVWQEMSACGKSLVLLDPSPAVGPLLSMTGLPATYTDH